MVLGVVGLAFGNVLAFGITILSCLYPAYRVWLLSPIEGMRHV